MNNIDDFIRLLNEELGMSVDTDDVDRSFDELAAWDSVYLLWLLSMLERTAGCIVSLPEALHASNLADIYTLAVNGGH